MASGNIIVHKPSKDFEMIPGEIVRSYDVDTIGAYCKLLSFGQSWKMNVKGLAESMCISPARVRKALSHLEEAGYLERKPKQDKSGKMGGWDYYVYGHSIKDGTNTAISNSRNTVEPTLRQDRNTENNEGNIYISQDNYRCVCNNRQNNKKSSAFDFRKNLIEIGVSPAVADAWMQVRKTKRATNTEIAFNALRREINNAGMTANDAITICVENSWSGFKAEYVAAKRTAGCAPQAPQQESWLAACARVSQELRQSNPFNNTTDEQ